MEVHWKKYACSSSNHFYISPAFYSVGDSSGPADVYIPSLILLPTDDTKLSANVYFPVSFCQPFCAVSPSLSKDYGPYLFCCLSKLNLSWFLLARLSPRSPPTFLCLLRRKTTDFGLRDDWERDAIKASKAPRIHPAPSPICLCKKSQERHLPKTFPE